jgi:hypothetical protein
MLLKLKWVIVEKDNNFFRKSIYIFNLGLCLYGFEEIRPNIGLFLSLL